MAVLSAAVFGWVQSVSLLLAAGFWMRLKQMWAPVALTLEQAGAILSVEVLSPPGSEHLAFLCLLCCWFPWLPGCVAKAVVARATSHLCPGEIHGSAACVPPQ